MTIEEEVFKKTSPNEQKLKEYGFKKEKGAYKIEKNILSNNFKAIITIKNKNIKGKIIDLEFNEEYTNIRVENTKGEFVNKVKNEYKKILNDIKNNCFESEYFIGNQANRITNYIIDKYNDKPEFLWEKYEDFGIFRNKTNNKWYAIIMNINKKIIDKKENKQINIINVKTDEKTIEKLIKEKGYYKGYHMNKKSWLTITLDETIKDEIIKKHIDKSYDLIANKSGIKEKELSEKVYDYLTKIPKGKVVTYKQIAEYLGNGGLARIVGTVLHKNPDGDKYPCYKVLNSKGELAEAFVFGGKDVQKQRLEQDGIEVKNYKVDLNKYKW